MPAGRFALAIQNNIFFFTVLLKAVKYLLATSFSASACCKSIGTINLLMILKLLPKTFYSDVLIIVKITLVMKPYSIMAIEFWHNQKNLEFQNFTLQFILAVAQVHN